MKLQNNTRISDSVIRRVLSRAFREVGAKSGDVFVQVNQATRNGCRGTAFNCDLVRWGRGRKPIACKGAFRITMPKAMGKDDVHIACGCLSLKDYGPLGRAERFYHVAAHEAAHIRDYQHPEDKQAWSHRRNGRRPAHDERPEECRANSRAADATDNQERHFDAIYALAVELENQMENTHD